MVDSFAWVEKSQGSEKGAKSKRMIEDADEARTPDIVLAEVARKHTREGIDEAEVRSRLDSMQSATIITGIDIDVGIQSARAFVELEGEATWEKL